MLARALLCTNEKAAITTMGEAELASRIHPSSLT